MKFAASRKVGVSATASLAVLAAAVGSQSADAASCACGYRDPTTSALWTDAVISYFNESSIADDVVFTPASSPSISGKVSGGDTGSGAQDWTTLQQTNDYNDGFSTLWRTGTRYNNTYLGDGAMQIAVGPADQKDRITYGGALLTRRRDILYGSLRASMMPPAAGEGGTITQLAVQYNSSEYIQSSMFSASDSANESTLQWTWSARMHDSKPTVQNLTQALGPNARTTFYEHRIDWIGTDKLIFSNNGDHSDNATSALDFEKKRDGVNLPTLGGPVSIMHYSSGDSSVKQSPPIFHQPVAQVLYARLFFNSSLAERSMQFEEACAAAGGADVCSTEDETLRGSTAFSPEALAAVKVVKEPRHIALYSIIACAVSGGLFFFLLIHALIVRYLKAQEKTRQFIAKQQQEQQEKDASTASGSTGTPSSDGGDFSKLAGPTEGTSASASTSTLAASRSDVKDSKISQDVRRWEDPDFLATAALDWDADEEEDSDDDSDVDEYEANDDPLRINSRPKTLESFGYGSFGGHQTGSAGPRYVAPEYRVNQNSAAYQAYRSASQGHGQGLGADEQIEVLNNETDNEMLSSIGHASSSSLAHQMSFSGDLPAARPSLALGGGFAGIGHVSDAGQTPPPLSRSASFVIDASGKPQPVQWKTPIVEWQASSEPASAQTAGHLAQRKDAPAAAQPVTPVQAATGLGAWIKRQVKNLFVGEGAGGKTASGAARVEYLDGLRGFACFLVSFHHFMLIFYYGETTPGFAMHYPNMENWLRRIFGAILTNGGLNVGIFFCLAARVIANRYLVRGRLQDMAEAIHRRVPRLMFPISAAILINYFLIEADAYHWVQRLASRSWSPWSYYNDYENLGVFINDYLSLWFTIPPDTPPQNTTYATGILWTVPVIVQSSWTVFICALIAREIPNAKKRYVFYTFCWSLSWYANRFDYFFIAGLIIADLDNRLKYRTRAAKGLPLAPAAVRKHLPGFLAKARVHGQVFAWAIFLCGAVVSWLEQIHGAGSELMLDEHGIHPDWATAKPHSWVGNTLQYTDPRLFDFFFVIGFFLLCDLCTSFRTFFQLRFWSALGRNAFSLYLLHGVIFWSWGSWLCLKLLVHNVPYWAAVLVVFLTSYAWLAVMCEAFTRTFDAWGVSVSKSFWRFSTGGLGRRL